MQGCSVALVVVLALLLLPVGFIPSPNNNRPAPASATVASLAVGGGPLSWRPIANTTADGQMYVDAQRGHILSLTGGNLLVMNLSGAVQATVWSVLPINNDPIAQQGVLDPHTGYLYLLDWHVDCKYNGVPYDDSADLVVVDTVNATILHHWWYPVGLAGFALHGNRIYAGHVTFFSPQPLWCFLIQDNVISVLNATDGTFSGNITNLPQGYFSTPPAIDPSGTWLFVSLSNDSGRAATYRLNLTDESYRPFGMAGVYAFSPDGQQLYVCDGAMKSLRAYRVATGALSGGGSCGGTMAVNPVTGMIASDGWGAVTAVGNPVSFAPSLTYVAWSPDGRVLLGINGAGTTPTIGTWDGAPGMSTWPRLLNSRKGCLQVSFDSVQGMDRSSLQFRIDGRPAADPVTWPFLWQACVGAASVPDGVHVLTVSGTDIVGRALVANGSFETDGSAPGIRVLSSERTNTSPYNVAGDLDEAHPAWLKVNGASVSLIGTSWSVLEPLRIGDNAFRIEAGDTVGNVANLTTHVEYMPNHTDLLANMADHISLYVPPAWVGKANASLGNTTISMMLVGPPDAPSGALFTVTALPRQDAEETPGYVMKIAREQSDLLAHLGGSILVEPYNDTLDGRPAATFEAQVSFGGETMRYVDTVVVSATWKEVYVLAFGISTTLWPAYAPTRDWLLQGFHIETPPPPPVTSTGPSGNPWLLIATVALAGSASAAAVWLARRNRPPAA